MVRRFFAEKPSKEPADFSSRGRKQKLTSNALVNARDIKNAVFIGDSGVRIPATANSPFISLVRASWFLVFVPGSGGGSGFLRHVLFLGCGGSVRYLDIVRNSVRVRFGSWFGFRARRGYDSGIASVIRVSPVHIIAVRFIVVTVFY